MEPAASNGLAARMASSRPTPSLTIATAVRRSVALVGLVLLAIPAASPSSRGHPRRVIIFPTTTTTTTIQNKLVGSYTHIQHASEESQHHILRRYVRSMLRPALDIRPPLPAEGYIHALLRVSYPTMVAEVQKVYNNNSSPKAPTLSPDLAEL